MAVTLLDVRLESVALELRMNPCFMAWCSRFVSPVPNIYWLVPIDITSFLTSCVSFCYWSYCSWFHFGINVKLKIGEEISWPLVFFIICAAFRHTGLAGASLASITRHSFDVRAGFSVGSGSMDLWGVVALHRAGLGPSAHMTYITVYLLTSSGRQGHVGWCHMKGNELVWWSGRWLGSEGKTDGWEAALRMGHMGTTPCLFLASAMDLEELALPMKSIWWTGLRSFAVQYWEFLQFGPLG
jgi:hypothetical protein